MKKIKGTEESIKHLLEVINELSKYEADHEITLPKWYKGYISSTPKLSMKDLPYEYVHYGSKKIPELLQIISNSTLFLLCDPEGQTRNVTNIIGDILKKYKTLKFKAKPEGSTIVTNLSFGMPAGSKV